MKNWMQWGFVTLVVPFLARGESSVLSAAVDLRPSWSSARGTVHSENEASLSYQFNERTSLAYVQEFGTGHLGEGIDLLLGDGYLRAFRAQAVSGVDYTLRLYAPTRREDREAGRLTILRNHFYVPAQVSNWLTLSFTEIPIWHVYSTPDPHPSLENRMEWAAEMSFFDEKLKVKIPVILQNVWNSDSTWTNLFWVNPEVIYSVSETTGLGLAFYTQNLIEDSLSHGVQHGIFQVVFQQVL